MRHLVLFAFLAALAGACAKKPPEPAADPGPAAGVPPKVEPTAADVAKDREYWLNALKTDNSKTRQEAASELSAWVETDAESVAALVGLLKDRSTTGAGKIMPNRINSTREAAAVSLSRGGPKGEAALKEKGLPVLREGLTDPDAAIREHTAYTVSQLGALARPLSADVMKLCTDPDANVRGAAFDCLRDIGISDAVGFTALLTNERRDVVGLASELVPGLNDVPAGAVTNLAAALADKEPGVRTSAAAALAKARTKAAPALDALVKAIGETYPEQQDTTKPYQIGPDVAYWKALGAIGESAVAPTAGLLAHKNSIVRVFAARTLGDIGAPAKAVADKLKDALRDMYGDVAVEAACSLCRIGEGQDEALALVKRLMDLDGTIAGYAIDSIVRMGEPGLSLVPAAVGKLTSNNPSACNSAVGLVGNLPAAEGAKYAGDLGKLASHAQPLIRRRVGQVLETLGPGAAAAAESLAGAIPAEKEEAVREQFVDALVAMGAGAKPALPLLIERARESSPRVERRGKLFLTLVAADPASKDVAGVLQTELGSPDPSTRAIAAAAVAKLDPMPPEALAKLVSMANADRATSAKIAALRALADAGSRGRPVKADVEKIAAGPLPEFALLAKVAVAAMDGNLGKVGADVRGGLTHKNTQVRSVAVGSLLFVGPNATDVPVLVTLLKDASGTTREAAAGNLARLGPAAKDAVNPLIRLLDDREAPVRIAAATALGEIGPAAMPAVEKLKRLRGDGRGADASAKFAAAKALEKLGAK